MVPKEKKNGKPKNEREKTEQQRTIIATRKTIPILTEYIKTNAEYYVMNNN